VQEEQEQGMSTLSYGGAADFCGKQNHLLQHEGNSERDSARDVMQGRGCMGANTNCSAAWKSLREGTGSGS
jgi:hypothetical protein